MLGHQRQGVQTGIAVGCDLLQKHGGLGQTNLHGALAFTLAQQRFLLALGLGGDDRLLGLLAGPGQSASASFSAIWIWTSELVSSVCIAAWAWASLSARSFSAAVTCFVGLHLLERELPQTQLLEQGLDLAAGFRGVGLADEHVHALDVEVVELPAAAPRGLRSGWRRVPEAARASSSCGPRRGNRR